MGIEHLQGKRTGRPRGSKSTPHWVRALRWAERNLDNLDAVPPSALAGRLLDLGREQPDKFLACLAMRDPPARVAPAPPLAAEPSLTLAGDQPLRIKTLAFPIQLLVDQLSGDRPIPWQGNLPRGIQVIGSVVKAAVVGGVPQRVLWLTIYSPTFPEVLPGAPIPELVTDFTRRR